jgi:hypothetical protein
MCMISGCKDEEECAAIDRDKGKMEGWQASKRLDVRMMEGQLFTRPYPCDPNRATYRPPSDHASPTINATRLDFNKDLTNIRHQTTSRPSIDLLWQAATETPSTPTTPHSRPRPGLQTRRNIMTTLTPPSVVCQTDGTRTLPSRQLRQTRIPFCPLPLPGLRINCISLIPPLRPTA